MTSSPTSTPSRWLDLTHVLAAAGFLYVLGTLVSNLYLLGFGAVDFTLIRPRAIATGLLVVLPMIVSVGIPLFLFERPFGKPATSRLGRLRSRLGLAQDWISTILFQLWPVGYYGLAVFLRPVTNQENAVAPLDAILGALTLWASGIAITVVAFFLVLVVMRKEVEFLLRVGQTRVEQKPATARQVASGVASLALFGSLHLYLFVTAVYPSIPRQLGGARPQQVELIIAAEAVDGLRQAGLGFGTSFEPIEPDQGRLSLPVDLIEEGEGYLLIRSSDSVMKVSGDQILATRLGAN